MQVEGLRLEDPPPRVRLFHRDDLHCTLAFLGDVDEGGAMRAWREADKRVRGAPVTGTFDQVRPLGNPRKPSALSAIVGEGAEPLTAMTLAARGPCLEAAGSPLDARPPLPHMTVARIQRRASARERRAAVRWGEAVALGAVRFEVAGLALYTWSEDRHERLFQIVRQRPLQPEGP